MAAKADKLPKGLQVVHHDGALRLLYRHHRLAGFFLFLAGLFWLFMLVPCYRVLAAGEGFGLWELTAFLPFVGAALGFGYVGLAKMLNCSEITFGADHIAVRHHPLPWFGNVQVPLSSVKGYLVKNDLNPRDIRHRVTVALVAELLDGTQAPLLRAIADPKAARRMHQEAQSHLTEMRQNSGYVSGER